VTASPTATSASPTEQTIAFGALAIRYDDRVLQPRAWTEAQSAWAAELMPAMPGGPVLELCAGAGHIGLLALLGSGRRLVTVDLNPVACHFTHLNAAAAGLADDVEVREGRIEEALAQDERFALVIADPPWVRRADTDQFPEDPVVAIDGGDDGLDVARSCVRAASEHLLPGGAMVLQLGTVGQVEVLEPELTAYGDLGVTEVRSFERGVLVRLDRPAR
jgi:release factor glutamine methyltransferase